nr:hypothetical protein [Solirubrobacterales bacterium]
PEVLADGEYYVMQTFDQALLKHVQSGRISVQEAMLSASAPHDFKLMIAAESRSGSLVVDTPAAPAQEVPPTPSPASAPPPVLASAAPPGFA